MSGQRLCSFCSRQRWLVDALLQAHMLVSGGFGGHSLLGLAGGGALSCVDIGHGGMGQDVAVLLLSLLSSGLEVGGVKPVLMLDHFQSVPVCFHMSPEWTHTGWAGDFGDC